MRGHSDRMERWQGRNSKEGQEEVQEEGSKQDHH